MDNEINKNSNWFLRIVLIVLIIFACANAKDRVGLDFLSIKNRFIKENATESIATRDEIIESNIQQNDESSADKNNDTENNKKIEKVLMSTSAEKAIDTPIISTRSKIDKFLFVGDIYFSPKVIKAYDSKGLDGIVDKTYQEFFKASDFNIGNLECAITDGNGAAVEKEYNLFTPEKYISALKDLRFDVLTLANNHSIDYGKNILLSSMDILKKNGISYVGAGADIDEAKKYFIKTIEGKKYAIFAASAVIPDESWKATADTSGVNNGYDIAEICTQIKDIRKSVDKIIVYMHWGEELSERANDTQRISAHKLVDFGADLVVGSHPHINQEIEYYKNTPIVYSLGNFIYGATKRETMVLEASFDYSVIPEGFLLIRIYPGVSNYEKVYGCWDENEFKSRCAKMQDKCDTCFVGDNGYIFTIEAVQNAINAATLSEVEEAQ